MLRFGAFEINTSEGELRKKGVKLRLQGQPLRLLALLAERSGELVTREELRATLWAENTFVDFDHSLNNCIARIREVLDDSADSPRFIETVPRRGYRFVSPVEDVSDHLAPAALEQATPSEPADGTARQRPTLARRGYRFTAQIGGRVALPAAQPLTQAPRSLRRPYLLGFASLAIGILALIGALIWARNFRGRIGTRGQAIASLAVLPLENLSHDPAEEYFSDGMTDALITQLARIGALRVISRTSAMRYKGTHKGLQEIATELNVDGVIEGSVMRSGNRVRIVVQLLRARTDQHVWAETYERELNDVLRLQSEVAMAVAQHVRVQITKPQLGRLRSASSVDPEAYETYLKGRFYEPMGTQTSIKQAQAYFEVAIREDPAFALAYVGLADCYLELGDYRWLPPQEAYRRGSEAIHKALQLEEGFGEAHSTLGFLDWLYGWDWQSAERELRYAVDLSPNYVNGHQALAWYLAWSGRRGEALAEVEKIRKLDPVYPFLSLDEAGVYYHQRDFRPLVEAGQKSVASYPDAWSSHYFLAVGYEGSGRLAQALPEYQQAVDLSQRDSDTLAGLAHVFATMGKTAEAEKILRELQRKSTVSYVSPYMIAAIYSGLGQKDKALDFLEKAYLERSPALAYFFKADLRLDALRSDPRFQNIGQRIGLPQ